MRSCSYCIRRTDRLEALVGRQQRASLGGTLFGVAVLVIGLFDLVFVAKDVWFGAKSRTWPTTEGKVQAVQVVTAVRWEGVDGPNDWWAASMWRVVVECDYVVDGITCNASRFRNGQGHASSHWFQQRARHAAEQYRKRRRVKVYYDPERPNMGTLEPGIAIPEVVVGACFSILLVVLGAVFLMD